MVHYEYRERNHETHQKTGPQIRRNTPVQEAEGRTPGDAVHMKPIKSGLTIVLGLFALMNLARGGVHVFSPDGGAGTIAGLDLSTSASTIIPLFALIGVNQIAVGLFEAYVVAARRDLLALGLGLQVLLTAGAVANLGFWRPLPVEVPGETLNMILLPIIVIAWLLAVYGDRKARRDGP